MSDYEYTGSQALNLPDRRLEPGCGRFSYEFTPSYEAFLLRAGIVRKAQRVEVTPPPEDIQEAAPAAKRR